MSYTIGDGIVTLALAGGIVGYRYVTQRGRQKRMEIIHQERMAAMEKEYRCRSFRWNQRGIVVRPIRTFSLLWERFFSVFRLEP